MRHRARGEINHEASYFGGNRVCPVLEGFERGVEAGALERGAPAEAGRAVTVSPRRKTAS